MPLLIACASGVAVLAVLVVSGVMASADLSHPFWQTKASVTGALIGAALGAGLIWITNASGRASRYIAAVLGLCLAVALGVTWRAARIFIDSAAFEPVAGQVWFFGYHALCALIVAVVALLITAWRWR